MLDDESSLRLNLLRFPLIVGVVYVHAYGGAMGFADASTGASHINRFAEFLQNLISQGLGRLSVPSLFLISGYLFFLNFAWSRDGYLNKLKSRIKSLLVPFLFWNLLILLITGLFQSYPATRMYFSGRNPEVLHLGIYGYLNAVIGIDRMPISYQFWYLRDLMVMILLSPFSRLVPRQIGMPMLLVVAICWLVGYWPVLIPAPEAALFFSIGGYLASGRANIFDLDRQGPAFVAIYLPLLVIATLLIDKPYGLFLSRLGIAVGLCAVLFLSKRLARSAVTRRSLAWLSGTSFFVYAIHEPLLTLVKKLAYRATTPDSSLAIMSIYLIAPVIVIAIAVATYQVLVNVAPKATALVTGGR